MKRLRIFLARIGVWPYPNVSPPMGLLYLAAYLRSKMDIEVRVVCQRVDNYPHDRLVKAIAEFDADIVGFSVMTPASYSVPELARDVRQAVPRSLILLGGAHVAAFGAETLENIPDADAAVPGEGELATEAIIRAWSGDGKLEDIPGIFRRDKTDGVVANPGQLPYIEDLDTLPFPAYDLIDVPAYWRLNSFPSIPRRRYISLFSSRGCPYGCIYCHRVFGKRFRGHSAQRMIEEIDYYQRQYGVNDFDFLDDIFNLDHQRLSTFCDLAGQRKPKIKLVLPNGVRTDILTEQEIDALADVGTYYVSFALESGSPRIQKLMRKNLNIDKYVENVERAARRGIFCHGYTMIGFPTETEAEMQQTADVACRSHLHTVRFFMVTPFPGTELYELAKKNAPDALDRIRYDDMEYEFVPVNLTEVPDEVYFKFPQKAYHRFYLNPKRIWRILRDYPQRRQLPLYLPTFPRRLFTGYERPRKLPH